MKENIISILIILLFISAQIGLLFYISSQKGTVYCEDGNCGLIYKNI